MRSASNDVIEWLLVVKMLETEIHLFRYSAIPLFLILRFTNSHRRLTFLASVTAVTAETGLAVVTIVTVDTVETDLT